MVITRFAPSPTGDPHIGNIRTAFFAYLFAKSNQGKFLLRIEDTDQKRHVKASTESIKDALRWLNIEPGNIDDPMVQSERLELYKKHALKLVDEGKAYVCDCSSERLQTVREMQQKQGLPPMYDKKCRDKDLEFVEGKTVIRLKVPENDKIRFKDLVRGTVEFDSNTVDDQILLKSDGFPTYHLAHVVDDHEMKITHIIRSEEWLSSTPKHILINKALGYKHPEYAHVPIILGPNKGKLSKRHGASGILEYRKLGYLPEALINFMAFLGWNPKDEREFFTLEQLEKEFSIEAVNKSAAVFDINKLNYYNKHYIHEKNPRDLLKLIDRETLEKFDKFDLEQVIALAKDRMEVLSEFTETVGFLIDPPKLDKDKLVFRKSDTDRTLKGLKLSLQKIEGLTELDKVNFKASLEKVVSDSDLSNGDVFWSVRYALTGLEKSPPPEEVAGVLGKEKTIERIQNAINILE